MYATSHCYTLIGDRDKCQLKQNARGILCYDISQQEKKKGRMPQVHSYNRLCIAPEHARKKPSIASLV